MPEANLLSQLDAYIEAHIEESITELAQLCRHSSVAAQGLGIAQCAQFVSESLLNRGFLADLIPTAGNPVILAHKNGQSSRTLLFYNHYDVQPPDPLAAWDSPPFELTRRENLLIARGACENKGELLCRLAAVAAVEAVCGSLPCTVKFLIEGEEEIGSPNLPRFIEKHTAQLQADACVWDFGEINSQGAPVQYLGMRGICFVELKAQTTWFEAHSGNFGSIFPNAAWRLTWALNSLKGPDERIRIAGFYDDVLPPTEHDVGLLALLPDETMNYGEFYGVTKFLKGLEGRELQLEQILVPSCTICGLTAGYQGRGMKTVLPAEARAKVDFRLVPYQEPHDIVAKLRAHLDSEGFSDIEVEFLCGERPARTNPADPFIQLVRQTATEVYPQPMLLWPMLGSSGPYYPFVQYLKVPIANAGISYPGSHIHGSNENIRIPDLIRGIKHIARIILGMATYPIESRTILNPPLTDRQQLAAELILEDEGLTDDLPDAQASALLEWASAEVARIAADMAISDAEVEAAVMAIRRAVSQVATPAAAEIEPERLVILAQQALRQLPQK